MLKNNCPHIIVGTLGRIRALARDKDLALKNVRHFILDECDKMLEPDGMLLTADAVLLFVWQPQALLPLLCICEDRVTFRLPTMGTASSVVYL